MILPTKIRAPKLKHVTLYALLRTKSLLRKQISTIQTSNPCKCTPVFKKKKQNQAKTNNILYNFVKPKSRTKQKCHPPFYVHVR